MELIKNVCGTPTSKKGELPISKPPGSVRNIIQNSMTEAEQELVQIVEDTVVENAEITGYNLLTQMTTVMKLRDTLPPFRQSLERGKNDYLAKN